jgi:transcriptional regulator of arginine metabolism
MNKQEARRRLIVDIIQRETIHSQEELQAILERRGVAVTQATLSRDLKALGIARVPDADRGYAYIVKPALTAPAEPFARDDIARGIRSIQFSGNLAVIKTKLTYAEPVALAIDQLMIPEVIGTVGGEDTILVVLAEGADRERFLRAMGSPRVGEDRVRLSP